MQLINPIRVFILLVISILLLADSCGVSSEENEPRILSESTSPAGEDLLLTETRTDRWEEKIKNFEDWDSKNSFPLNAVLFVGSSSIRLWPTREYFPEFPVINRGFGGSHISDVYHFAHRIVLPYRPKVVVFYAGDNDIAAGKSPRRVFDDYRKFANLVHKELPATKIIYVGIKPSLSRWSFWPLMKKANLMVKAFSDKDKRLLVFDSASPLTKSDGKPDQNLFLKDNLHLNTKGYDAWTAEIKPIVKQAFAAN
jgi:lysophospholipase L1-like esterase